jgi:Flp pilus assembly protein TadG
MPVHERAAKALEDQMHNEDGSKAAANSAPRKGFLTRLARDIRGNTLAIVGAALVPLAGMIGSGVDMSRAYMAKTRLQSACDAAALAGRRIMNNDTMTTAVRNEANRFFNFNFRQRLYDTEPFTPVVTRPVSGTVRVTASTRIPTTIMHIFGFESLPLHVTCDASLNFVNTDIMLVLDVTGSMDQSLAGTPKIVSLRDAVMALYDELAPIQTQLEANGLRMRYGIVPYSSTVNVGNLLRLDDSNNLAATGNYSTRVANYTTPVYTPVDTPITTVQAGLAVNPGVQRFQTSGVDRLISNANCTKFGNNNGFTQSPYTFTATGINNDADIYDPDGAAGFQASAPAQPTGYVRYQFSRNTPTWSGNPANRVCDRNVVITRRSYTVRYGYTDDTFLTTPVNIAGFRTGNSVTMATDINNNGSSSFAGTVAVSGTYTMEQLSGQATGVNTQTVTWGGCIMERQAVTTITPTTPTDLAIPVNAFDININMLPTTDASRWRPLLPQVTWGRSAGTASQTSGTLIGTASCPAEARRLAVWNRGNMQSYVNALTAVGSTYHDVGMIWGARMLSTGGVFADGCETFNAMPCTRHIIFMTDGQMDTDNQILAFQGIERNDQRVSGMSNPSEAELNGRHMQRFKMVCNAARGMNTSIWVIAFGTTLSPEMLACASNANQASTISDRNALIARFREIGNNIGALRLTQ